MEEEVGDSVGSPEMPSVSSLSFGSSFFLLYPASPLPLSAVPLTLQARAHLRAFAPAILSVALVFWVLI